MCIRPIASSIPPLTRMASNKTGSENIHSTKSSRDTLVDGIIKMLRKCSASTCSMHVCMLVTLVVRRCRATKSTCRYTKTHSNTDSLSLSPLPPPLRTQDWSCTVERCSTLNQRHCCSTKIYIVMHQARYNRLPLRRMAVHYARVRDVLSLTGASILMVL